MERPAQKLNILLVEDNPADAELTRLILQESRRCDRLELVTDGQEALDYLRRQGPFKDAARPDLVLLDLNMPRINGREVLKEIKTDDQLQSIPVVILTISEAEEDILGAYQHNANCFISKPVNPEQFDRLLKTLENFWFNVAKLPPRG
jgi:two-component system response regulator